MQFQIYICHLIQINQWTYLAGKIMKIKIKLEHKHGFSSKLNKLARKTAIKIENRDITEKITLTL